MRVELFLALVSALSGAQDANVGVTPESLDREARDGASVASYPEVPWRLREVRGSEHALEGFSEVEERVWLDEAGPGALLAVHAEPGTGTVRVRLDGEAEPVLQFPAASLEGAREAFAPLPFARRCVVTCDGPDRAVWIELRSYAPEIAVVSATAAAARRTPGVPSALPGRREVPFELVLSPHDGKDSVRSLDVDLPGRAGAVGCAIVELRFAFEPDGGPREARVDAILRSTTLHVVADGLETVAAPLDALIESPASATFVVAHPMPFRDRARLSLRAHGAERFGVSGAVVLADRDWSERSLYFHARWTSAASRSPAIALTGRGRLVGASADPGAGTLAIALDGRAGELEARSDSRGHTAWSAGALAAAPFERGAILGLTGVPAERAADLTAWFYAEPAARIELGSITEALDQRLRSRTAGEFRIEGALECESLTVADSSPNLAHGPQDLAPNESGRWSAGRQLFVRAFAVGQFVELALPVAARSKYEVVLYPTRSWDYGTLQCSLDGVRAGEPLPMFNTLEQTRIGAPRPVSLGTFELSPPAARLRVEVVGTDPRSRPPHYHFGLDCVVLKGSPR